MNESGGIGVEKSTRRTTRAATGTASARPRRRRPRTRGAPSPRTRRGSARAPSARRRSRAALAHPRERRRRAVLAAVERPRVDVREARAAAARVAHERAPRAARCGVGALAVERAERDARRLVQLVREAVADEVTTRACRPPPPSPPSSAAHARVGVAVAFASGHAPSVAGRHASGARAGGAPPRRSRSPTVRVTRVCTETRRRSYEAERPSTAARLGVEGLRAASARIQGS